MKRFWAVGALILTVAVAVAIFVIPALAAPSGGTTSQTDGRSAQAAARLFAMEHQHSTAVNGAAKLDGDPYAYSCAGYGATDSNLVVEVTEAIVNDADSGQAGNYWAFDNVNRSITIWNVGPGQYCILVNYYKSTFHAIAGQTSPGMGGTLSGEEYGSFKGAALFTVSGQFAASDPSAWPTEGRVNGGVPVDYQCDVNGNCPGYVSFLGKYFNTGDPSFNYAEPQWGWTYVGLDSGSTTKHPTSTGTWINAYTGNSGDILDVD